MELKSTNTPDGTSKFEKGKLELAKTGGVKVRALLQP
jgi:hypothetical protein